MKAGIKVGDVVKLTEENIDCPEDVADRYKVVEVTDEDGGSLVLVDNDPNAEQSEKNVDKHWFEVA